MSWRNDPRVKNLLDTATIENILEHYFERVYEEDEIEEMKRKLKQILEKYDKEDMLFEKLLENEDNEMESLMKEVLGTFCEETMNDGKTHTPETMVTLAKLLNKVEVFRLACEVLWCCASLLIQEFITNRQLNVKLHLPNAKGRFARALSADIQRLFYVFEVGHSSFYTNRHDAENVNWELEDMNEFIQKLREFKLSNEMRKELENKFNADRTLACFIGSMNWRNDPRIRELLKTATIENILKHYFERVYEEDEIQRMRKRLEHILGKYYRKDMLFEKLLENDDSEMEPLMKEVLNTFCEKTMNDGRNHTPETMLTLAKLLNKVEVFRLACEVIWCTASLLIQEFITDWQLNIKHHSCNAKRLFARSLSYDLKLSYGSFKLNHSSFRTDEYDADDVNRELERMKEFIQKLREFKMSDETRKELEDDSFNDNDFSFFC